MKFCPECGSKLVTQKFCPECGENLSKYFISDTNFQIENQILIKYTGKSGYVVIPQGITEIFYGAFQYNSIIHSVEIPEGVKIIGRDAFKGCYHLKKISLPSTIEEIYEGAFCGCSELDEIRIPEKLTRIRKDVFRGCTNLTNIHISKSMSSINDFAFWGCLNLTNIFITDLSAWCHIRGLSALMRNGARNKKLYLNENLLTDLMIPDSVTHIESAAFLGCNSIINVHIPNSITSIGDMFQSCPNLQSVTISQGVKHIDRYAFANSPSLISVTFPDSIESIAPYAFSSCTALQRVDLPKSLSRIESHVFENCTALTKVTIPEAVTSIEENAFLNCSSLTEISVPDSVMEIGKEAFKNCSALEKMVLPFVGAKPQPYGDTDSQFGYIFGYTTQYHLRIDGIPIPYYEYNVPHSLKDVTITGGNALAFSNCTHIQLIRLPDHLYSRKDNVAYDLRNAKITKY